ncbi:MAG: NosD domain-containing protein [Promethearchaeota archaeon]
MIQEKKKKIEVLLILVFIFSSYSFLRGDFWNYFTAEKNFESTNNDSKLKTADFWPNCPPIHIANDNWSDADLDWIQNRTGDLADPHLIENVTINAGASGFCILIENSEDYFVINNCTLFGSSEMYFGLMFNNVTNGKIINSTFFSNQKYGIWLNKSENNIIQKNKIFGNEVGIRINGSSSYNNFSDNQIHHNFHRGFELETLCENNIIFNNTIENNGQSGIWAKDFCTMNIIKENNLSYNGNLGISFQANCNHNNISQNRLVNNTRGMYFFESTNNTLAANQMVDCGLSFNGNSLFYFDYNIDTSNTVNGKSVYYYFNESNLNNQDFTQTGPPEPPGQIILAGCNDSLISDFNISSSSIGVSLHFCENITIRNNTLNNNREYGIDLTYCYNITIDSNEINNSNFFGIKIRSTTFSKIIENNVSYNEVGIHLRECFNNNITKNRVKCNNKDLRSYDHAMTGILLENCENNTILENTLINNTLEGLHLVESNNNNISENIATFNSNGIRLSGGSEYNLILNNTMNNNTAHQDLESSADYGNGIFLEWSNYNNLTKNKGKYNGKSGIYLFNVFNVTILENQLTYCGLYINFKEEDYLPSLSFNNISYNITDNEVNAKPLIYRWNEQVKDTNLIKNAGQIILINCNNSIISNTNITHATVGITLYNCSNNIITNNSASFNSEEGLLLNFYCHNNSILKNNFSNCRSGIIVCESDNSTISQCFFKNNLIGLLLSNNVDTTIITNNSGINNIGSSILVFPEEGVVDHTKLSGNEFKGGGITLVSNAIQEDTFDIDDTNTVNDKRFYYYYNESNLGPSDFTNASQVYLVNSENSYISDLDLFNVSLGLFLFNCSNTLFERINLTDNYFFGIVSFLSKECNFSNCIINNNQLGLVLVSTNNSHFSFNELNNNDAGLYLQDSSNNIFFNNSFNFNKITNKPLSFLELGGGYGLYILNYSDNNIISNNTIKGNERFGIYFEEKNANKNNTIQNNRITDNKEFGILIEESLYLEDNKICYNNFINNEVDAEDSGVNNTWDDGYAGNYWDEYKGEDLNPEDGIGDIPFLIDGTTRVFDSNPLIYPTYEDTDGDRLYNYEEYIPGSDTYRTNVTNPDSDGDGLNDYWEALNLTNPWNKDTDFDNMEDLWEVLNGLEPLNGNDNLTDSDNDQLLNIDEFKHQTDPKNNDSDGDTFLDGIEVKLGTEPLIRFWYPMPNLAVVNFHASTAEIGKSFVLNFTIINNGIWEANNIEIIIRVEYTGDILYNNSDTPIEYLGVNKTFSHIFTSSSIDSTGGDVVIELIIDPNNLINETYGSRYGELKENGEGDNYDYFILEISGESSGDGGDGLTAFEIILIIVGVVALISIISIYLILKPKINKRSTHKKQLEIAIKDIENFESNLKSFIKLKLQSNYESEWWGVGIPEYIRSTLDIKMQTIKPSKLKAQIEPMDAIDLSDSSSIITNNENWNQIFSTIFPNKDMVETNLMNLSIFKKGINQGIITSEQLSSYPLFINNIRSYFTQELNVFLSYSTLDSKHFNIKEIAKRLETYPKVDKVFFWEEDSGENIVSYMERTLKMTKVFVFFCSQHSVKSRAVEDEWQAAFQMRKKGLMKIVPVYETEELIPFLLTPLLNVKFTKEDFDGFIEKLHEEIIR